MSDFVPAMIRAGRIIDVDPVKWTLTVRSEAQPAKTWYSLPVPAGYLHVSEGEGAYSMPEVGACVHVCEPSDGSRPFIANYRAPSDDTGTFRANRPPLNPGDHYIGTRDRNFLKVRRGGVVEIQSRPLCRTMWIPTSNTILTIAENWKLEHLGGSLRWETARPEEDPDGESGTLTTWKVKEFAGDKAYVVQLRMGGQIDDTDTVFDLRVYKDGDVAEDDLEEAVSLAFTKAGDVTLSTAGDADVALAEGKHLRVRQTAGNEEGVILGRTLLTQLAKAAAEWVAVATSQGLPTVESAKLITDITTSLAGGGGKGGAPYLSTRLQTE